MIYLTALPSNIRYLLADITQMHTNIKDALSEYTECFADRVQRYAWEDAAETEQVRMLPENLRSLFRRLMREYIKARDADPKTYSEYRAYWDSSATGQEALDSITIVNLAVQDAPSYTGAARSLWAPTPDTYYDLDGIVAMVSTPANQYEHLTLEWDPNMQDTDTNPALYVKVDPTKFPAHLRRYITETEIDGRPVNPARRNSNASAWKLVRGKAVHHQGPTYACRGVVDLPQRQEVFLRTLNERRAQHRDRVLRSLPGYIAERTREDQENRAKAEAQLTAERRYQTFRSGQRHTSEMHIPTLPLAPRGTIASRRWGIEIETGAGRDLRWNGGAPEGWDSKDDGSLQSAYGERWIDPDDCPEYFNEHQATITVNHGEGTIEIANPDFEDPRYCDYCGETYSYEDADCVELVSPILTSVHSTGLRQICEDLEFAPRTDTAGVHVHVEAKDLTVAQVKNLVLSYDRIEPLIEASYDRAERGYCKRRSVNELLEIARQQGVNSINDLRTGDRYVTVNLNSIRQHGTIEFRAMGPRYNYDHLTRWAMFCREMVNTVKNGATSKDWNKVNSWAGVEKMFERFGNEYNGAAGVSAPVLEDSLAEV